MKSLAESFTPRLKALAERAQAVATLTRRVREALPADIADHVISASYRADELIVLTDSSAWCAQVRYAETDLRERLVAQGLPAFEKLRVRVRAPVNEK
jgi:hypothetical protein